MICNNELKKREVICQRCFDKVYFISSKKCKFCGRPIKNGKTCKFCRRERPSFDFLISSGNYVFPFSEIIKIYKYKNRPVLSSKLARKLYSSYLAHSHLGKIDYLTWVPMRRAETRERGYNQSELLAKEFAKISSLKCVELLYKASNIPSQTKLPEEKRINNVKEAYKIKEKELKKLKLEKGKSIIIIDDVLTTGSTLNECAKKLKEVGFKKVYGLVLAISP